jgi:hypothetical protein
MLWIHSFRRRLPFALLTVSLTESLRPRRHHTRLTRPGTPGALCLMCFECAEKTLLSD